MFAQIIVIQFTMQIAPAAARCVEEPCKTQHSFCNASRNMQKPCSSFPEHKICCAKIFSAWRTIICRNSHDTLSQAQTLMIEVNGIDFAA